MLKIFCCSWCCCCSKFIKSDTNSYKLEIQESKSEGNENSVVIYEVDLTEEFSHKTFQCENVLKEEKSFCVPKFDPSLSIASESIKEGTEFSSDRITELCSKYWNNLKCNLNMLILSLEKFSLPHQNLKKRNLIWMRLLPPFRKKVFARFPIIRKIL